jgi:hypothetical protein
MVHLLIAVTPLTISVSPTCVITTVGPMVIRALSIVAGTAAERSCIVVISVARSEVKLPPVVIAIVRG